MLRAIVTVLGSGATRIPGIPGNRVFVKWAGAGYTRVPGKPGAQVFVRKARALRFGTIGPAQYSRQNGSPVYGAPCELPREDQY